MCTVLQLLHNNFKKGRVAQSDLCLYLGRESRRETPAAVRRASCHGEPAI